MKLQIPVPLWLFIVLVFCVGFAGYVAGQDQLNARLTSDATLTRGGMVTAPVPPGAIFVPPSEFIFIQWRTNHVPLVVREEISSNVFRASVWWANGKPQTNFALMASNLISVATNVVQ